MPDTSKLPKWAQTQLHNAERRAEIAEQKLARNYPESNTLIDRYDQVPEFFPQDANITFRLDEWNDDGKRGEHHRYIQARIDRDSRGHSWLYIMGGSYISVLPQSSNTVRIFLDDR